jgi:oleate hydratase
MGDTAGGGRHYFVGGGIASLAAAVFLVRDAAIPGPDIRIFEQLDRVGGSLDGSRTLDEGYLVRGGRMFEEHFACTLDLMDTIPSPDLPGGSLKDDLFAFNAEAGRDSNCRLVRGGRIETALDPGLGRKHFADLVRLLVLPERLLQGRSIASCFDRSFFDTNFWLRRSATFAFQPWHSAVELRRYFRRFVHLAQGPDRGRGILWTRFNQQDSLIAPVRDWLVARGVGIETGAQVTDVAIADTPGGNEVTRLEFADRPAVDVAPGDRVYLTLGSMTDGSTVGLNGKPPPADAAREASWDLWLKLAARHAGLGRPETFHGHRARTEWQSFTVTLGDPGFFRYMRRLTGVNSGTGGLVTFADSAWLMSLVMFHQPHFRDQAAGAQVFWGYGLRGDRPGDHVAKPMRDCTGAGLLAELAGHLRLDGDDAAKWFDGASVASCRMPYITSQFMPRRDGDRPAVRPKGAANFACIGQFCEIPRDTVFTVEYSVRSAWMAVYAMTGKGRPPPPVVRNDRNPAVLARAAASLLRN